MALPSNISTGRVTGQFIVGVVDGEDTDDEPDFIPATGIIVFTATTPYLPNPAALPNPVTMLNTTIVGVLDSEGYLCTPLPSDKSKAGKRGLRLIATDDKDASVEGWTWTATPRLADVNDTPLGTVLGTITFALPSDGTVDLTTVVEVPASQGIGTPQILALAAAAQASAASSAADAAAVKDKALANDAGVADLLTEGVQTVAALTAKVGLQILESTAAVPRFETQADAEAALGRGELADGALLIITGA